jgi:hypothetical protein
LAWSDNVERMISLTNRKKSSDAIQHVNRIRIDEIDKWKFLLNKEQISEISTFYRPFGVTYYRDLDFPEAVMT